MSPIEVTTVSQWNTTLREAKSSNPQKTIIVDWYAVWCGPCKAISPYFDQIAAANPRTIFLRVNVEGPESRIIATKYRITAMPTFTCIKNGEVVQRISGPDLKGIMSMVQTHGTPQLPSLQPEAEREKVLGNKAFISGDYQGAIEHYSKAIEHAPNSAVLYANRAFSYIKLYQNGTKDPVLGANAVKDANKATEFDPNYSKGWVRLAEALLIARADIETMDNINSEKAAEGKELTKGAVVEALEKAVGLAAQEGNTKLKAEAQKKLEDLKSNL
ncbi:thioredoxin-domain-containing protein [Flagelloscypha sp. PMI_526]|nr:thioredoxin-domain-containing protein [Flagelloscypha sp. PMI_526]